MRFEKIETTQNSRKAPKGSSDFKYKIVLEEEKGEIRALMGAYHERIHRLSLRGNASSVRGNDRFYAKGPEGGIGHKKATWTLKITSAEPIIDELVEFGDRTSEVVAEIPETTNVPAYANDWVVERSELGAIALQMANEMQGHLASLEEMQENPDDAVRKLMQQLDNGMPPELGSD